MLKRRNQRHLDLEGNIWKETEDEDCHHHKDTSDIFITWISTRKAVFK